MTKFSFRRCFLGILATCSVLAYLVVYSTNYPSLSESRYRGVHETKVRRNSHSEDRNEASNEPTLNQTLGKLGTKRQDVESLSRSIIPRMVPALNLSNLESNAEVDYISKELPKWLKRYKRSRSAKSQLDINETEITSAQKTRYQVINSGPIYKGDIVRLKIEACDVNERPRNQGGDFWFTWLSSQAPLASISGTMIDFDNGTYEVNFLAAWTGNATTINIMLVHSSDAAWLLKDVAWPAEDRIFWFGKFEKDNVTEITNCSLKTVETWDSRMCIYYQPSANGRTAFACSKPTNLPCSSIQWHTADKKRISQQVREMCKNTRYLFAQSNCYQRIKGNIDTLRFKESSATFPKDTLPECRSRVSTPPIPGYWLDGKWNSFTCRTYSCWTKKTLAKCLQNKQIYFLGDSNSRQYAAILLDIFKHPYDSSARPWYSYIESINTSIHWQMHPHWIGSGWAPWDIPRQEADMFDSFVSLDCNYVVVVSNWAHFSQWPRNSIIERFLLLREAVNRFHARCPDVPVIIKSPHARDHRGFDSRVYMSDFILNELRKLLRDIFEDTTGVMYLDVWDMNLAYPVKNHVHMPEKVVEQELDMLWSYVCECDHKETN